MTKGPPPYRYLSDMLRRVGLLRTTGSANSTVCWAAFVACGVAALASSLAANAQVAKAETVQAPASKTVVGTGLVGGVVTDTDGELIQAAQVTLTVHGAVQTTTTGSDGRFQFKAVPPGSFRLAVTASGRAGDTETGTLTTGQSFDAGTLVLHASADLSIEVLSPHGTAEIEVKQEEHQRVLGFAPNFYVSYDFRAPALDKRQKWELNWRTLADPVNIGLLTVQAGIEQATGAFSGFGPGPAGYGKRLGAASADFAIGNTLQGCLLPIVFRQDPRYFYLGTGSKRHRLLYALSTAVIARGDNGKWQPAYANVLGSLGTGAISNAYYPAANRQGAKLTFENAGLSIAFDGVGNVLQEFVLKHVSTGTKRPPTQP